MNKTGYNQQPAPRWRERLAALRNLRPLFSMVWEAAPKVVASGLAFRFVAALIPLSILAVTRRIIDAIYGYTSHQRPLPAFFWWLVVLEFALATMAMLLTRLTDFCDTVLGDKYMRYISTRIMEHASQLDLTAYEDPEFYDKMERARVQGPDRLVMIQMSGRFIQQAVTTVSLAGSILLFSPWILLALVVCLIPAFLGETHFAFEAYSLNFQQTTPRRQLDYLRVLGGSKESAKELKLFGLGPFLTGRYVAISDRLHEQTVAVARRRLIYGAALAMLGMVGYYGTYAFVIYRTVIGALTLGTMTFLVGAIAGTNSNIQTVFSTFSGIADQALFMKDLLDFFAVGPHVVSKPGALPAPRPIRQGIEFRNVAFAYPGTIRLVLRDVSFRLEHAERIALVGENGEGKTTIVKLLTRLYDPTGGAILLDGIDLRELDLESLWKEIGVIFQDFVRYEMTASENIAIGRIEQRSNRQMIQAAADKSFAEATIRKLPKGYDQVLGCRFEGGIDLSGGEWQKVALARAYLRDAQLLILDEPTAALDARSEHQVFQRFSELTAGKMALLISHRFSTVRMADHILVLEGGRISEQGAHDQLVRRGGHYAEMFELQASNYR